MRDADGPNKRNILTYNQYQNFKYGQYEQITVKAKTIKSLACHDLINN